MKVPRPRDASGTVLPPPIALQAQACSDVGAYLGVSEETVAVLLPDTVRAWASYLASARHGHDPVQDLLEMAAVVTAGLRKQTESPGSS